MADNETADHTVDLLRMIGGLAEALGTAKELIDNLNSRVTVLEVARLAAAVPGAGRRRVQRIDDDSPMPRRGTVVLQTSPSEYVWVVWDGADQPTREAHDELTGVQP